MKRSSFTPKPDWKPLQRKSGLKTSKPMARGTSTLKPVGRRGKRMRQGKVAPTTEEQAWMDDIVACGCLVCWMQKMGESPAEVHHFKEGDRRKGHLFTIALCKPHHRGGDSEGPFISRHPWKKRWERAYGTEDDLLEVQRARVANLRASRAIARLKHIAKSQEIA
jgi:hypothetical protein